MFARAVQWPPAALIALFVTAASLTGASTQTAAPPNKTGVQETPAATAQPVRKSAASKSANVKNGVITALDSAADTLTLRDNGGKTAVYVFAPKTHFNKGRRPAQKGDFKTGDAVVLHFRRGRTDGALLITELDDAASWTWLTEMRKTTTLVVIKSITDNALSATVGVDKVPIDYTISEKTRWEKGGKETDASAFKPGDRVYVVPRSLPSGGIMARAISDSSNGALREKERLAASVHGTILAVDQGAHKVTMKTVAGDTRNLAYTDDTEFVQLGKSQPLANLKAGLIVTVRLRHDSAGDEVAWRFTVGTTRKTPSPKKRPTASKGAVATR